MNFFNLNASKTQRLDQYFILGPLEYILGIHQEG
jgi:hypothetical protein